jgi:hypothetical protein
MSLDDILLAVILLGLALGVLAVSAEFLPGRSDHFATVKSVAALRGLYQRTFRRTRPLPRRGRLA